MGKPIYNWIASSLAIWCHENLIKMFGVSAKKNVLEA